MQAGQFVPETRYHGGVSVGRAPRRERLSFPLDNGTLRCASMKQVVRFPTRRNTTGGRRTPRTSDTIDSFPSCPSHSQDQTSLTKRRQARMPNLTFRLARRYLSQSAFSTTALHFPRVVHWKSAPVWPSLAQFGPAKLEDRRRNEASTSASCVRLCSKLRIRIASLVVRNEDTILDVEDFRIFRNRRLVFEDSPYSLWSIWNVSRRETQTMNRVLYYASDELAWQCDIRN